jgi:diguanylate cyclase (GGDEF)-like protein/PAS domain S-box-containing protein
MSLRVVDLRARATAGAFVAVAAFAGGLAWARQQRRTNGIIRQTVDRVLAAGSNEVIEAIIADATTRLSARPPAPMLRMWRRRRSRSAAVATLIGLGEFAHRRTASARLSGETGSANALIEQARDAILVVDDANRIRFASASARALFGTASLHSQAFLDFVEPSERGVAESLLQAVRQAETGRTGPVHADLTMASADGRVSRNELICRDLRSDASIGGLVITLRDVTRQRRLEHELTRSLFRDRLTDLPNQASFRDSLSRVMAADTKRAAVVVLDVDRFRVVNEGLGRATGDQVLVAIARRLQTVAGDNALTARLGSDEFAILVENVDTFDAADALAARVQEAFAQPLLAGGDSVSCSASIGVATTAEADTDHEILSHADLAHDAAKVAGPGSWRRYEPSMVEAVRYRTELLSTLGRTLDDGSLIVEYQPILSLTAPHTVGFEALVRWRHPTRGQLSPAEFIDIVEDSELIHPVGKHVLSSAIATAATWPHRSGQDPPYVSVNVSVRQFRERQFADSLLAQLERGGLAPRRLVLEITESLLLREDDLVWEELSRLHSQGIRIAIDDFGTGYSALGYLRQVPLDIVKLDRVFISTLASSDRQRALVAGIVGLVKALGLDVVAEGIETQQQRDACVEIGCSWGQGYLFARSMPASATVTWLDRELGRSKAA